MKELEQLLGLFGAAVLLAAAARRVGAPYPVFLALGGALLAFVPATPAFSLPPELALALFVASLAIIAIKVPEPDLITVIVVVVAMAVYDFLVRPFMMRNRDNGGS